MKKFRIFSLFFFHALFFQQNLNYSATFTWTGTTSSDIQDASNWTPTGGPPAEADTVIFDTTAGSTTPSFIGSTAPTAYHFCSSLVFTAGAPAYTFTINRNANGDSLQFYNTGVDATASAVIQNFSVLRGTLIFINGASADVGSSGKVKYTMSNSSGINTIMNITNGSFAGAAEIIVNAASGGQNRVLIQNGSDAQSSTIRVSGSQSSYHLTFQDPQPTGIDSTAGYSNIYATSSGKVNFLHHTTADHANININAGTLTFDNTSQGGNATVTATNGSTVSFVSSSNAQNIALNLSGTALTISSAAQGGNAAVTLTNSSTLTFNPSSANTNSLGSLETDSSSTTTINNGAKLTIGSNNNSTTVAGRITTASTGSVITKTGSGTLTLTNTNNNCRGGIVVNQGTLKISSDGNIGSGSSSGSSVLTLNTGATLQANDNGSLTTHPITLGGSANIDSNGYTFTISSAISGGSGILNKTGSGTLILSGTNSYGGGTTIAAGTLQGTVDSIKGNVSNSGFLIFDQASNGTFSGVISGTGSLTKQNSGVLTLSGSSNYSGATTVSGGTLQISNDSNIGSGGILTLNADTTLQANGNSLLTAAAHSITLAGSANIDSNNSAFTISSVISGASYALNKTGAGTLILTGTNLYGGGTTVSAGTLQINNNSNIGSGVILTLNAGTTLQANGNSSLTAAAHSITLGGSATIDTNGSTFDISSVISGAPYALNKSGAGTLILTGTNTYGGGTTVSAGTLRISGDSNIGSGGSLTLNANTILQAGAAMSLSSHPITLGGSASIDTNGHDVSISSIISGASGLLNKINAGTLTLTGTNTYGGGTTVSAGTLQISDDSNIGSGGSLTLNGGTTLRANNTGSLSTHPILLAGSANIDTNGYTFTIDSNISGNSSMLNKIGTGTLILTGTNTYGGGTNILTGTLQGNTNSIKGNIFNEGSLVFDQNFTGTCSDVITGSGSLTKQGSGILTLSNTNSYYGATTVSAGTLRISGDNNIGLSGILTLAGGTTLQANGVSTLSTSNTISLGGAANIDSNGSTFTISSDISGASGSLTKTGTGILTLSGTNTYTGGTTVSAGTLSIYTDNNIGSGAGVLTLKDGTTLQLSGHNTLSTHPITLEGSTNIDSNGFIVTIGSNISGDANASLNKIGSNTLILTGTNTYGGGTTVSAGILSISSDSNIGSGTSTLTLNDGTTLLANGDSNLSSHPIALGGSATIDSSTYSFTIDSNISGASGILNKTGTGTVILTGSNTYGGGTNIYDGTLQGTTNSIRGDILNNSSLIFDQNFDGTCSNTISGSGSLTKQGLGVLTLSGTNTYLGGTTLSGGTLRISSDSNIGLGGLLTLDGGTTLQANGPSTLSTHNMVAMDLVNIDSNGSTFTINSNICGSPTSAINKIGAGTLILTGTNCYALGTTVSEGTLCISSDNNIGSGPSAYSILTLNNGTTLQANGTSSLSTHTITLNGAANIDSNGSTFTISSIISGASGASLTKTGAGTLVLEGANTYDGGTTVSAGILRISTDSNIGSDSTILTLNNGTTLQADGLSSLSTHPITLAGAANIDSNGSTFTISSVISGASGSLTKTGTGTLTLEGINTYGGGTTVSAGTLKITNDNNIGSGTSTLTLNDGSTLQANGDSLLSSHPIALGGSASIDSNGSTFTISSVISGASGTLNKTGAGTLILTGTNTYGNGTSIFAGTLQGNTNSIQGNIFNNGSLIFDQNFDGTCAGIISGSGSLTKEGLGGVLTLTGTNIYTGATSVSAGTLKISSDSNIGIGGLLTLNAGTTLQANGSSSLSSHAINLAGSANIDSNGSTFIIGSSISGSSSILTKTGAGTLVLTGTNTYSGGTVVSEGTLRISSDENIGSSSNAYSVLTLNNGTTLQANGVSLLSTHPITLEGSANIDSNSSEFTISSFISGDFGLLNKIGAGTLVLTGSNTYGSGTTVSEGVLKISSDNNIGSGSYTNTVLTLNNGSTLQANGTSSLISHPITLAGSANIDSNGSEFTISSLISGASGALTKTGAGTLILTGSNNYNGGTTISAGTLKISGDDNIGVGGGLIINSGATLQANNPTTPLSSHPITLVGSANIDSNGYTFTIDSNISGASGALNKIGSGTLILTGTNTYGAGTSILAGTLQGSTSSIKGNILDNGSLIFNQNFDGTCPGDITGSGSLTKQGSGKVILSGTNSYSGGTTISTGTLQGSTSSVKGNIFDNGSLIFDQNFNGTCPGDITGSGSLTKQGSGTVILLGTNFYSGGTTISAGTLQGNTDSIQGTILNNSSLILDQSFDGTYSGAMSGSGSLTKQGSGTVTLSGANIYTGGTTISAGALNVKTDKILGNIIDNGLIIFDQTFDGTYSGNISGSGSFIKQGSGKVILSGTNSYSGGTTISAGILQGNINSIQGNILDNGILTFNQTFDGTYLGNISGAGSLRKQGSGKVILSGKNSYSDGTTIYAGTLQGDTNSLQGNIQNNANIIFDQNFRDTFKGSISGTGNFTKTGKETLIFSGGNNSCSVARLSQGRLIVNNILSVFTGMTVDSEATLSGYGTINGNVFLKGFLSPGNSIGTINLVGNQTFASGSTLEIEVSPSECDLVNIIGTLAIQPNSTLSVTPDMANYPKFFSYPIVRVSDSFSGAFTTIKNAFPSFIFSVIYDHFNINSIVLNGQTLSFADLVQGGNPGIVAKNLDQLNPPPGSPLEDLIIKLKFASSTEDLREELNEIQPSKLTAMALAQEYTTISIKEIIFEHFLKNICDYNGCCASNCKDFSVWVAPFKDFEKQKPVWEEPGFKSNSTGILIGLDKALKNNLTAGAAICYSNVKLNWSNSLGYAKMNNAYVNLYTNLANKYFYVFATILGGYNHCKTERIIYFDNSFFDLEDLKPRGSHHGIQCFAHLREGAIISAKQLKFSPFIEGDCLLLHENRFTEKDGKGANLTIHDKNSYLLQAEGGLTISGCFHSGRSLISPFISASALYEDHIGNAYTANFVGFEPSFTVYGFTPSRFLFHGILGLSASLSDKACSFSLKYGVKTTKKFINRQLSAELSWNF